jgi:hypothetical protein
MQSPSWGLTECSPPKGTLAPSRRTLLDRCTLSATVPVVGRCLQHLKEPMAVHLESQHGLYVAPGILYRSSFPGCQPVDFIKSAPQLPLELITQEV